MVKNCLTAFSKPLWWSRYILEVKYYCIIFFSLSCDVAAVTVLFIFCL